MSSSSPQNAPSTPAQFRSKLGTYLTGVAIGFIFLGIVYYFKSLAVEREQATLKEQQQQQPVGVDDSGATP